MIKQYNGAKAQRRSSGREVLPAGGYVARILNAEVQHYNFSNGAVDKLVLSFDILEGKFKDFFKTDYQNNQNEDKKWRGVFRITIPADDGTESDGWAKNAFNNFIYALEDGNPGYTWAWDETTLKGKVIGVLFRNKEWEFNGNTGWTTECCAVDAASAIREGNFKMPKDKPLSNKKNASGGNSGGFAEVTAEESGDLPF